MDIEFKTYNKGIIAYLVGDIDHHVANDIKNKIEDKLTEKHAKNLIFEFSKVKFMDSSGIGMVIGRYKLLEKQGGKVYIVGLSDNVKKLFALSGLSKIIKSYSTLEECLKNV